MKPHSPTNHTCSVEWLVALLSALVAGVVFVGFMPPAITMESGAYVAASFDFGVPATPGYPFWTCCGFLWTHFIFPFGNPAWRLGMMSVTAGALLVGVVAVTMMRSTLWLLDAVPWGKAIGPPLTHWLAACVAISAALLFGFDRTVWAWACVPQPQALYTLLYFLAVASFLGWIREPNRRRYLYAMIVCLSLTEATADLNAWQVWAIMALPFVVGVFGVGIDAARASVENHPGKP